MRPKVKSNRFEISNQFEKLFRLHGSSTAANLEISNRIQKLFCLHSDFPVDLSAMVMVEWNSFIMSNVADGQCRSTCTYALFMFSLSR